MQYRNERASALYVIAPSDDTPGVTRGALIPQARGVRTRQRVRRTRRYVVAGEFVGFLVVALLMLVTIGYAGQKLPSLLGTQQVAAPAIVVEHPRSSERTPLRYGSDPTLSQPAFFAETKAALRAANTSFIEADLTTMELVYYEDGSETFRAPIRSKGTEGSWWETPAGLYDISYKAENHFSSFGDVYQPYSMAFQGNFFIHGWPYHPGGAPVAPGYSGGCIRLSTEDAQELFAQVPVGTPVLVHEEDFTGDDFVYEPAVPELPTPHYLVADIGNNTVLAARDITSTTSIASITKLMTALVAAEHINLDTTVPTTQETFVPSLIPRLDGRTDVSMYSLMQLLLVESSNEAAEVIAAQLGRDRFITLMNEKAAALGLTDTTFADPSGLQPENISTTGDLLRLTQYIYHNRRFILELTANHDLDTAYQSGAFGELTNFNKIDGLDNFIGGKVGETRAAGQTSVSLHRLVAKGEPRTIAVIVLGSDDRAADVAALLAYVTERFGESPVTAGASATERGG